MMQVNVNKKTPPFFSVADINMSAMSNRRTLARPSRTCSVKAGVSFLQKEDIHQPLTEVCGNIAKCTLNPPFSIFQNLLYEEISYGA